MTLALAHSAKWQLLFTAGTMIARVTSVLAGATGGLALSASAVDLLGAAAVAIPLGPATFVLFLVDERKRWIRATSHLSRSPAPT